MKKELQPFFGKKRKTEKMKARNGFDYLIGKKCSYQAEGRDFECQIIGFDYVTEDKWPYTAYVLVKLLPFENADADDVNDMLDGVALDSINGIDN
tara:strand:+ start:213 stop:497 length:285 start_codon:yes stop_codon:yes gene_type:complete